MIIKCEDCGADVIEGEIKKIKKDDDKEKKIFDVGTNKPSGTILKNGSSNPKRWTGMCSECQATQSHGKVKA